MKSLVRISALVVAILLGAQLASAEVKGVTLPRYETINLPNGMRVLLMERHDVPLVAFHARIRAGSIADPEGKAGTAGLLADLLYKGAGKRNAQQFSEAVDGVGGIISTGAGREAIIVSGEFMSRDTPLMLELLSDMLLRPALSGEELEKLRSQQIDSIGAAKDSNPAGLMANYFFARLYGDHPFGTVADETSLSSVTVDDVRNHFRNHVGADRTVLALVGDFDAKAMAARVRSAFGDWRKASAKVPALPKPEPADGGRVLLVDKPDATQTYFWIGNLGVARDDSDRVLLDVANTAFGGRFTSMLNTELRIKTGLSYGARSVLIQDSIPGVVAISSYTKTESTGEAIDRALAVLDNFREHGLDDETLASVKAYVAGQFPPDLETGTQLASKLTEIAFYGLGNAEVDEYAKLVDRATRESTKKVIDRVYPDRDSLTIVMLGNADAIRDVAKKYGEVTEMKIVEKTFRN